MVVKGEGVLGVVLYVVHIHEPDCGELEDLKRENSVL